MTGTERGDAARELMEDLWPLCRSLSGAGTRETLARIGREIPLTVTGIRSGTEIFDWIVPDAWELREAHITGPDGSRVVDVRNSSLHVVSYSEPVRARMSLEELRPRLFSLPEQPDLIPYRTSYYERTWGFCLAHRDLERLAPGDYDVVIDADLGPGEIQFAECVIPGESDDELLISTYVCHPSLANDNLSGIAVATMVGVALLETPRRLTCRLLFAPGTIGPLMWLHTRRDGLHRVRYGLALSCLGDGGDLTYKRSRQEQAAVDEIAGVVLRDRGAPFELLPWEPWGGDERQFCAPGFDLPVGSLMRTPHGRFPGYHTSADSLDRISAKALGQAVEACLELIGACDSDEALENLSPFGEPQLGRRGLFRTAGGAVATPEDERALLWVLNMSDGHSRLAEIAARSGLPYLTVERAARRLEAAGLLGKAQPAQPSRQFTA
jgi:aminopeptidase-like protein